MQSKNKNNFRQKSQNWKLHRSEHFDEIRIESQSDFRSSPETGLAISDRQTFQNRNGSSERRGAFPV
jgi:hypothetical protein